MSENGTRAPGAADRDYDAAVDDGRETAEGGSTSGVPEADPMEALARDAADARDRWLRALAEMENLRRRTEREVADARQYGVTGFARDMVGIADNLRRALDAVPAELRTSADTGITALIEGVELIDRELAKALERHGVRKLDPKGQKFDPNFHQAMFEIPDASVPAGTVAQVVQEGYVIGDRVLRPALVGVSKGGPRSPASVAPADDNPNARAADPSEAK
jgi:molecular chaperone GrpE